MKQDFTTASHFTNTSKESDPTRRTLVKGVMGLPLTQLVASAQMAPRAPELISRENAKQGTTDWQLTNVLLDKANGYRSPAIEGYCSHQSIEAGQTLEIMASANPPGRLQIEIFRMGYYGGCGARLMSSIGPLAAKTQPDPDVGARRLRECRWEPTTKLKIPIDWPSGVYLGRL